MCSKPHDEFGPLSNRQEWGWKEGCCHWCCSRGDGYCVYAGAVDCEWMLRTGIEMMALGPQADLD